MVTWMIENKPTILILGFRKIQALGTIHYLCQEVGWQE